jgi:hypothetical protein
MKKLTQQEAEERVLEKCKEKNCTLLENFPYINAKIKLHLKCNIDNYEWNPTYDNFINNNNGCPKCAKRPKITQEEAEKNVLNKCKERNYFFEPFIYINNKTKLHLKCKYDNYKWYCSYNKFINSNSGCPKCNESKGELEIAKILKEKNIYFEIQKKFDNCKNKLCLPFDFYLPDKNILIEFDGGQHYKSIKHFGGEKGFKKRQLNDKIKTEFAKNKNIKLIRITNDDNIEEKLKDLL